MWAKIIVAVTDFNIFFKDGKDYETTSFSWYRILVVFAISEKDRKIVKSVAVTIKLAHLWKEQEVLLSIRDQRSTQDAIVKWTNKLLIILKQKIHFIIYFPNVECGARGVSHTAVPVFSDRAVLQNLRQDDKPKFLYSIWYSESSMNQPPLWVLSIQYIFEISYTKLPTSTNFVKKKCFKGESHDQPF